ncbi:exodeoxyribonuclease V subunit gamma [Prochlorococcus sp. MIT 1307]|uniref:exodeoxyribonuclease V subunit gamma n=1 Tax=Prochlorococcus sp. MIT 1307 TaxID=3096219 RepID=UPI002A74D548|nr:exodeoxyribonuclease V subunit gamma [Prochlorococcus sp. MIT 1307]
MLTIYRSNRAEWLANVLSEHLRLKPPSPFETVEVIVNTWPVSRWLGEELATVNGISALIRFPFPGTRLKELVKLVLGLEEKDEDPWKANRLVWHILEVLPELLKTDEASLLREWLKQRSSKPGEVNRDEWQLASSIADAFDDYALYRINEITQWLRGTDKNSSKFLETNAQSNWQPLLINLLSKRINREPFGLQVKRAIDQLKHGTPPAKKLPSQLHIFGLSSLAPVQVELIQALSGFIDIKMYLITPCRDLWQRCELRRHRLGKSWSNPLDGYWLLQAPRLEANLGRMGAEFQQLLEGSGESQLGEWKEGDLFAAPANISIQLKREPTLLEQLQQQLVTPSEGTSITRKKDDTSLTFMACPGQRRQVQLVRDQILQWLASDSSLEPKDILIMTPQVKLYSPLISSAFNDKTATNFELPYKITDRSQQDCPGLTQYMLLLLQLASTRINATAINSLLTNPAIQKQQCLTQEDVINISDLLQVTGFRWGLDAEDRDGNEVHSLSWCLDRWLLGLVLPSTPGLAPGGIAPFSKGIKLNDLTQWWNFLSLTCNQLRELRYPRTCEKWVELLRSYVKDLFGDGGNWALEFKGFLSALEVWRQSSVDSQLEIDVSVAEDILSQIFAVEVGRFGHRSGVITISALEPMRAIPHRAIVLMGLDSNIFPRHKDRPGFHLLGQKRELGDPMPSDQDRYVLLEALISARQHLMITWNSRNEHTGEPIPAASPIQQWLTQLESQLGKESVEGLLREPHPNPLARANFVPLNNQLPISCDQRNLEARIWLNKRLEPHSLALALPLKWDQPKDKEVPLISTNLLKSWLKSPQRIWLEGLQLKPREWINPLRDFEDLNLNELQRYHLLRNRFEELLEIPLEKQAHFFNNQREEDWETKYEGQGKLPPLSAARIECELLENRWQNLLSILTKLGPCRKRLLLFDGEPEEILWAGDFVIVIELGKLKSKNVMEGWVNHLQTCASSTPPTATLVISRNSSKSKRDQFQVALQWDPLPQKQAREELNKLKAIALHGLQHCWPVPPESGWAFAKAKLKDSSKGMKAFQQNWNGIFNIPGERETTEMQLCFGIDFEANMFTNNKDFIEAFSSLYDPLIEVLSEK